MECRQSGRLSEWETPKPVGCGGAEFQVVGMADTKFWASERVEEVPRKVPGGM